MLIFYWSGGPGAGSTHLRYATPWQARWHVTVLPLRFSTGLVQPTFAAAAP
ncbi:MAG: hypothetical protein IJC34_07115 [Lentisphaeria bacterium]|nr:hypothetical protein [Lentisphaeria bacterium]